MIFLIIRQLYFLIFLSLIFDSLLQFYTGRNILGNEIILNRISSFLGEELIWEVFCKNPSNFLVYLVMVNAFDKIEKKNLFYIIVVSSVCLIIYLSGERTSFLLILFFLHYFYFKTFEKIYFVININIFDFICSFIKYSKLK